MKFLYLFGCFFVALASITLIVLLFTVDVNKYWLTGTVLLEIGAVSLIISGKSANKGY